MLQVAEDLPESKRRVATCRLLQRKCAAEVLGIAFSDVQIRRTKGRKPFVVAAVDRPYAPNFNFNVSHEVRHENLRRNAPVQTRASVLHCNGVVDVPAMWRLKSAVCASKRQDLGSVVVLQGRGGNT